MVCLGNICRSPLAEAILASKLPSNLFKVDSAGTGHWHVGQQPDSRSIETAFKRGLDITSHRVRQIQSQDFETFDYIFVMDDSNFKNVIRLAKKPEQKLKVQRILNVLFPGEIVNVPDPYYGSQNAFEQVFEVLDKACDVIAQQLMENHSK